MMFPLLSAFIAFTAFRTGVQAYGSVSDPSSYGRCRFYLGAFLSVMLLLSAEAILFMGILEGVKK